MHIKKGIAEAATASGNNKESVCDDTTSNVINVSGSGEQSDINSPLEYDKLERWQKLIVTTWIKENFVPRITINKYHTSYEFKHIFERSPDGFYLTNGAFKGVMLAAGFTKHGEGINWCFAVTEKSIKEARKGMCY